MLQLILLLLITLSGVSADGVIDSTDQRNFVTSTEIDIIKRFFELERLNIDLSDTKFLNKYSSDVITKMNEMMLHYPDDPLGVRELNEELNTMILDTELKNLPHDDGKPFEPSDKAILRALDLMIPETAEDSEYFLAKKDLRKFYDEQPMLAKELLERIKTASQTKQLSTRDVARLLRNFYYHWIPLGRLMEAMSKPVV